MNIERIANVVKYALCVASESEEWQLRSLRPIHLLKYLYLADLAQAEKDGQSYTGIQWRFHNFGPWNFEACQCLEQVIDTPFQKRTFQATDDKEGVAWSLTGDSRYLTEDIEKQLSLRVTLAIKRYVSTFYNDTKALLHEVYRTRPMTQAKPGDELRFEALPILAQPEKEGRNKALKKKLRQKMLEHKNVSSTSRKTGWKGNDAFLKEGIEWLDELEESELKESEFSVKIDASAWDVGLREKYV